MAIRDVMFGFHRAGILLDNPIVSHHRGLSSIGYASLVPVASNHPPFHGWLDPIHFTRLRHIVLRYQIVPPRFGKLSPCQRKDAAPRQPLRLFDPGRGKQGRQDVDPRVDQLVRSCGHRLALPTNDQWNTYRFLIEHCFLVESMRTHAIAMIAGKAPNGIPRLIKKAQKTLPALTCSDEGLPASLDKRKSRQMGISGDCGIDTTKHLRPHTTTVAEAEQTNSNEYDACWLGDRCA